MTSIRVVPRVVFAVPMIEEDIADHDGTIGAVTIDDGTETYDVEELDGRYVEMDRAELSFQQAEVLPVAKPGSAAVLGDKGRRRTISDGPMRPKGTFFRDDKRRVDYVLVYEHVHHSLNLVHMVQNLRRLSHLQPYTLVDGLKAVSTGSLASVTTVSEEQQRREFYLSQLLKAGLELEMHEYEEKGETVRTLVFVKIHVPWSVVRREAERLKMKLPLLLKDRCATRRMRDDRNVRKWLNFLFSDDTDSDDRPSDFGDRIAWPFVNDQIDRFDLPATNPEKLLLPSRRSEIAWEVMQSAANDPHCPKGRGIESLIQRRVFEAAFPLHDGDYEYVNRVDSKEQFTSRQRLHAQWATMRKAMKRQPLNRVRNYFGEKVAFYFAFMDFYLKMLVIPSIFGSLAFLYGLIVSWAPAGRQELARVCDVEKEPGKFYQCPICPPPGCSLHRLGEEEGCDRIYWQYRLDNISTMIMASLNVLWCAFFVKFWRRREASLAAEWGTHDAQAGIRVVRPDFEKKASQSKKNAVTDEWEPHVPRCRRLMLRIASILITLLMLCAAASCLALLIVCRVVMYGVFKELGGVFRHHNIDAARWIQHGFMFIMVSAFEAIYHRVAEQLTKWECPKTMSAYMSSLSWKVFTFAHLVDFLPIAYAAWLKGRFWSTPKHLNAITEMCEAGGCMSEVIELVAVLLLLRLFIQNMAEVGWPAFKAACARFLMLRRGIKRHMQDSVVNLNQWSQFLKDYHLSELKLDGVSPEYMEMIIQFSFVAFFVPALPLVPLICLINNIFEIRIDAFNFLASHRRPLPVRVPGIQIWNKFLDIIVKLSVVINAGLLAFTSEMVPRIFHMYIEPTSNNGSFAEFVQWSLSWQPVDEWKELKDYVEKRNHAGGDHVDAFGNLTHCAYFGYRHAAAPHTLTKVFYEIMTARLLVFAVFVITFYLLIYLINWSIDDVPKGVRSMILRRQYIVTRALEEEAFRKRRGHRGSTTSPRVIGVDGQVVQKSLTGFMTTMHQVSVGSDTGDSDCGNGNGNSLQETETVEKNF